MGGRNENMGGGVGWKGYGWGRLVHTVGSWGDQAM